MKPDPSGAANARELLELLDRVHADGCDVQIHPTINRLDEYLTRALFLLVRLRPLVEREASEPFNMFMRKAFDVSESVTCQEWGATDCLCDICQLKRLATKVRVMKEPAR